MNFNGNQNFFMFRAIMNNQNINNQMNNNMNIIDVYPYILEDKKIIIFKRYDNTEIKVKIPNSLRKNELYSTANYYKLNKYADILLSYNSINISEDESLINDIPEGAEIFIIEEVKDIETDYYKKYLEKHNNEKLINIIFSNDNGLETILRLSLNTTIKEMLKIYLIEMNIPEKYKDNYTFRFNAETINNRSDLLKNSIYKDNSRIQVIEKQNVGIFVNKGIILKATIKHNNNLLQVYNIGTLNQIKDLYSYMEKNINNYNKIEKKEINGIELQNEDENKTFSSLGIRKDFICKIKYVYDKDPCCCIII